jgi:imidazolonepropionase
MPDSLLIRGIGRLFTSGDPLVVENAAIVVEDGRIAWTGRSADLPAEKVRTASADLDAEGRLVTAGLIDAHTHPVYGGDRFEELSLRSAGAGYAEIAAMGGGITSSVRATRRASPAALESRLRALMTAWVETGTTTLEAKSGYFLERAGELGCLRLLRRCADTPGMPSVEITFLGAHALPPELAGGADDYVDEVASWCHDAHEAGARHADVFCDEGYFTVDQSRRVLTAAAAAGLLPRIHADELARTGGAKLAAELGCTSADHLLRIDASDAAALAAAGTVATLAPVTALAMGSSPPARLLAESGVTVALGSDHNPGMSGTTSMPLVVALAVAELGLSVAEALVAATAGGAASLRLADRGRVAAGLRADLAVWEAEHEGAFAWSYGLVPSAVIVGGVRVR